MKNLMNNQAINPTGAQKSSAFGNSYLFTGRRLDNEIGLYYYRNRYCDARSGRFVSRDPLIMWFHNYNFRNPYHFVDNNATDYLDPLGLETSGIDEKVWTYLIDRSFDIRSNTTYIRGAADCSNRLKGKSAQEFICLVGEALIEAPIDVAKTFSGAGTLSGVAKEYLKSALKKATNDTINKLKDELLELFQTWQCERRTVPEKFDLEKGSKCGCRATLCINKTLGKAFIRFQGRVGKQNPKAKHYSVLDCKCPKAYDVTYRGRLNGHKITLNKARPKVNKEK